METSKLALKLHEMFIQLGYQWKIGGKMETPTPKDLEQTLDRAKVVLYDEPVPSQIEFGRLIIRRHTDNKFDVYLHLGDYND